jgi:hypothetical protein
MTSVNAHLATFKHENRNVLHKYRQCKMIASIIIILGALFWLLIETNWLTISLPIYMAEPVIDLPNLRKISWTLNTHGILALAGIVGPLILVTMDLIAALIRSDVKSGHQTFHAASNPA